MIVMVMQIAQGILNVSKGKVTKMYPGAAVVEPASGITVMTHICGKVI